MRKSRVIAACTFCLYFSHKSCPNEGYKGMRKWRQEVNFQKNDFYFLDNQHKNQIKLNENVTNLFKIFILVQNKELNGKKDNDFDWQTKKTNFFHFFSKKQTLCSTQEMKACSDRRSINSVNSSYAIIEKKFFFRFEKFFWKRKLLIFFNKKENWININYQILSKVNNTTK